MTLHIRSFEPLQDCCCISAPRILLRSATCMAFNFSAAPEKAPLTEPQPHSQSNTPRAPRQKFSRMNLFPAY
ncbi:MAG TPA: hypothetical protein VNU94_00435 [Acidobacteriaceae bacterium]|jgi:hypothetical protein|nr:hypothetical protein [Acidobacteriaceae bacterium]